MQSPPGPRTATSTGTDQSQTFGDQSGRKSQQSQKSLQHVTRFRLVLFAKLYNICNHQAGQIKIKREGFLFGK